MADPIQSPVPKLYTPISPAPESKPAAKPKTSKPAVDPSFVPSGPPLKLPAPASGLPKGVSSADVSTWPMPVLEREALAIQVKLTKDPKTVTQAEKDRLTAIEQEVMNRNAAVPKLPNSPTPKGVEFCRRTADLPGKQVTGLKHHWLKTGTREVGMGVKGGGVPGHEGGPSGYPGVPTTWNDHAGEAEGFDDAECTPLPDVDPDCVEKSTPFGADTGRWLPPFNDCHTATEAVIENCTKPGTPTEKNREDDAGVP